MKGLTKRQREIVDYIQEFVGNHRYSPSYREISQRFGFSSLGSVYKHIHALKRKGILFNESRVSRSLELTNTTPLHSIPSGIEIPYIGNISAGIPIQTFPQTQQVIVPHAYVHVPEKTYALRVQGDTLSEEMVADGDLLLVEARQDARPGELVVALINGHDTIVKKYYPEGELVRFVGSQPHHHPILLREEDILIQGVVIGLLRFF